MRRPTPSSRWSTASSSSTCRPRTCARCRATGAARAGSKCTCCRTWTPTGGAVQGAFVLINDITRHRLAELRCANRKIGSPSSCRRAARASSSTRTASSPTPIRRCSRSPATRSTRCSGRKTLDFIAPDQVAQSLVGHRVGAGDRLRERRAAQGRHAHRRRVHRAHDDAQRRAAAHDHRARHPRPPRRAGAHPPPGAPRLADRPAQPLGVQGAARAA